MRSVCAVAGAAFFVCSLAGLAESKIPCDQKVNAAFQSRANLVIESQPAGLHIVGTDEKTIRVSCTAGDEDNAQHVHLHFTSTPNGGHLSIEGTHLRQGDNSLEVKIEIPRRTNLRVHMFAGEVRIEELKGNKDIDLGAGQITIASIHDGDYRSVNASVSVGEVQARAFGADKGGFFRNFTRRNLQGEYQLYAHVATGEIDLLGNTEHDGQQAKPD